MNKFITKALTDETLPTEKSNKMLVVWGGRVVGRLLWLCVWLPPLVIALVVELFLLPITFYVEYKHSGKKLW